MTQNQSQLNCPATQSGKTFATKEVKEEAWQRKLFDLIHLSIKRDFRRRRHKNETDRNGPINSVGCMSISKNQQQQQKITHEKE